MKLIEIEECGAKCVNNVSCETSAWSEWQPCNVSCGRGHRIRTRKFLHRLARKLCQNIELEQKESCMGPLGQCQNPQLLNQPSASPSSMMSNSCTGGSCQEPETIERHCAVTSWSEWTPCSVECGKGLKYRNRLYINAFKSKNQCDVKLIEVNECYNKACTAQNQDPQRKLDRFSSSKNRKRFSQI